jgi:hypothetical protein
MPGINLNLPIPSLSDTQTQVVTKIANALTLIGNDLTPKVVAAELNINSALDLNGNAALNAGYITFGGGTPGTTIPGAIYYNNGEWFLVDGTATIQITAAGALNLTLNGAIGGDYSAVAALLSYDNAGTRYRFFGAGGTPLVDLDARKLALNGASAVVTLGVDASLLANKTINFKSLPAANVGLLAYDAAATAIVDGSTTAITASPTFTNAVTFNGGITVNGNITANALIKHGTYSKELSLTSALGEAISSNTVTYNTSGASYSTWVSDVFTSAGLIVGDIPQSIIIRITKANANNTGWTIFRKPFNAANVTMASGVINTAGTSDQTLTIGSPIAIAARERWYFSLSAGAAPETISSVTLQYTQ